MNNLLLEIENTRVPIMLIGLSERNLLEDNRKLILVTDIKIFNIRSYTKENPSEKRNQRKTEEPEDGDEQKITCLQITQLFLSYAGSFA